MSKPGYLTLAMLQSQLHFATSYFGLYLLGLVVLGLFLV